ncbi:MAG: nuclear transport factor 2 family protein [Saprospiraceae bacterium]|nr:nuclear transport factor 2 family protein [Pyrinomonadaceae bacterium]
MKKPLKNPNLTLPFIFIALIVFAQSSPAQKTSDKHQAGFQTFLTKVDAAQLELQNGKVEPFKSIWSQGDDVTLSGGFGGTIEKGWKNVGERLDWVGKQFSNGTDTIERLVANTSGDLGYVVQLEHIRFKVPGQQTETTRDYRVTMIFRRESAGWRIVHRQADSQMAKQAPK